MADGRWRGFGGVPILIRARGLCVAGFMVKFLIFELGAQESYLAAEPGAETGFVVAEAFEGAGVVAEARRLRLRAGRRCPALAGLRRRPYPHQDVGVLRDWVHRAIFDFRAGRCEGGGAGGIDASLGRQRAPLSTRNWGARSESSAGLGERRGANFWKLLRGLEI